MLKNKQLSNMNVPMRIVRILSKINEYKGKQQLYLQQSPQTLNTLKEAAIIQSTTASNRIEGIVAKKSRLHEILTEGKLEFQNRSEGEIAGYKEVLNTIYSSFNAIPISANVVLQLHRDLYKYIPAEGGKWKNADNLIEEELATGEKLVKFRPLSAFETPRAMEELCNEFNNNVKENEIEPLILIADFILDFLCIHPFNDGNGRIARVLTLLLLYKFEYEVGRFISLEKIIEDSKESYYRTLYESSLHWHEGEHDPLIWAEYFLSVMIAAYKDFEQRVGIISNKKGNKSERIVNAVEQTKGEFTKEDIRKYCPDVGESTINRVLVKLKEENTITPVGRGRNAKWRKHN